MRSKVERTALMKSGSAYGIPSEMALAAADVLARFAQARGLERGLLPSMTEWDVVPDIAVAVATTAQRQGLTDSTAAAAELHARARAAIVAARDATHALMDAGLIAPMPTEGTEHGVNA